MYGLLVFDLDGTLIDSALDLALSVNAVRTHFDLEDLPHERIYSFVGDGAAMLIRRALEPSGCSDDQIDEGLEFFLRYYDEHMLDNTRLYPGVGESLEAWQEDGYQMAVLTNKPVVFSREIIAGLGLSDVFFEVLGGNSFDTKKPDPEGLQHLMVEAGVPPAATLMIGDSSVDVLTARNAKAVSAGVTYGLRPESFEKYPPDILADSMPLLLEHTRELVAERNEVLEQD